MKKHNHGFSLVEVVVALAILSVVGLGLFKFLDMTTNLFHSARSDNDTQNEAQVTANQIQDMIIDTNRGVSYVVGGVRCLSDEEGKVAGADTDNSDKKLYAYSVKESDSSTYQVVEVLWSADDKTLYYKDFAYDAASSAVEPDEKHVLAEHVAYFAVDLSKVEDSKQVSFTLGFENGKDYQQDYTVTLRNGIRPFGTDSTDGNLPFLSTVEKVIVTPETKIMQPGTSFTFTAEVIGTNSPIQDVVWTLENTTSKDTKINKNGTVSLGKDETSTTITVRATSVQDNSKSGTATIYLQKLDGVSIEENLNYAEDGYIFGDITISGSNIEEEDYTTDLYFTDEAGNALQAIPLYSMQDKNQMVTTYKIDVSKVGWAKTIHIYGDAFLDEWEMRSDNYISYTRPYGYIYSRNESDWKSWVLEGGKPPRGDSIPKELFSEWDKGEKIVENDIGTWNYAPIYDWGHYELTLTMKESGEVWKFNTLDNGKVWKLSYNGKTYTWVTQGTKLGSFEPAPTDGWYQYSDGSGFDW